MEKYDAQKAILYAREWWDKRNNRFYNFDQLGGDCTNFVSQCLFYGGLQMQKGWHYYSLNSRSPSWTGVEEFYSHFVGSGRAIEVSRNEVGEGGIIQLDQKGERFNHNVIVTKVEGEEIFVACHSADAFDKKLSEYNYLRIRFLKIL